jgi:hypothetical protein
MYMACSGATSVYASCLTGREHMCTKICILRSGVNIKEEFNSVEGNGIPSKKDALSEANFSITMHFLINLETYE